MREEEIGKAVVQTAIEVHIELGPGLFESVYETVMADELHGQGFEVRRQVTVPVQYKEKTFDRGFIADLIVENLVILELKSVENLTAVHKKQVLTYLKLTGCKLGFLLNFGSPLMKKGICRLVNGLYSAAPLAP